jgi:hypothetical protein
VAACASRSSSYAVRIRGTRCHWQSGSEVHGATDRIVCIGVDPLNWCNVVSRHIVEHRLLALSSRARSRTVVLRRRAASASGIRPARKHGATRRAPANVSAATAPWCESEVKGVARERPARVWNDERSRFCDGKQTFSPLPLFQSCLLLLVVTLSLSANFRAH